MELYKKLTALGCFTKKDLINLTGSSNSADWHIRDFLKKGYIERIRRDLYAVISMETDQPIPNRFQIATYATNDACIVYHSAFEYYGYANQVFYTVYFATEKRVRSFTYDGISYCPVIKKMGTQKLDSFTDVRATSLEKTVVDSIDNIEKAGGIEELLRCLVLIPSLNEEELLVALDDYSVGKLYQKVGYVLESIRDEMNISESFFNICEEKSSDSRGYFSKKQQDFIYHDRWRLYAPKDLKSYINKGVNDYGAI